MHWTGADGARMGPLRSYLSRLVVGGFPPAFSLAVWRDGQEVTSAYGGYACAVGQAVPTERATLYDLASLTKVVCTVPLSVIACGQGLLSLDDPVAMWLPKFPVPTTTVRHLLSHTSGLIDHRPFFLHCTGREEVEAAVYQEAESSMPGATVAYSDLNFMLLGWVIENAFGTPLDQVFQEHVALPLGMKSTFFSPSPRLRPLTAATELDGDQRLEPGLTWGSVHDGNAYAMGGVAGHAGLFSPLDDMSRFATGMLSGAGRSWAGGAILTQVSARQAATGDDVRGLGWRLSPPRQWGSWPQVTVWHTGFTGTSLLLSPGLGVGVVFLTNAVHPHRRLEEQGRVRAAVHRLISEALE